MKKLFLVCLAICAAAVIASKVFAQTSAPTSKKNDSQISFAPPLTNMTIVLTVKGDTIIIYEPTKIKVIKIGDKCYSIVKHETTIEESKSQLILGGTFSLPNQYWPSAPLNQLLVSPQ